MSIVAVGSSCIDEILFVNEYPQEDRKIRSNGREIRRGGNAANTSEVLSRLGNKSIHFVGTIGAAKYIVKTQEEQKQHIVLDSLSSCHVSTFGCHHVPESLHNIATIILSQSNASRTVVSTNELRELYFQEFLISLLKIQSENDPTLDVSNLNIQELQSLMLQKDMSKIQWIHFEGRNNVIEMRKMMEWIINVNEKSLVNHKIRMSLEIETRRAGDLTTLISYLDYIFFSYDFSKICGFEDVSEFLLHQQKSAPKHSFLVCTMGSKGAQGIQGLISFFSTFFLLFFFFFFFSFFLFFFFFFLFIFSVTLLIREINS